MNYIEKPEKPQVLETGKYKGYKFYICFSKTCPTAYVKLDEGHPLYGIEPDIKDEGLDYSPNWGFTYSDNKLGYGIGYGAKDKGWFIGWDYGHSTDYDYFHSNSYNAEWGARKWTLAEIEGECMGVIDAIERKVKYEIAK